MTGGHIAGAAYCGLLGALLLVGCHGRESPCGPVQTAAPYQRPATGVDDATSERREVPPIEITDRMLARGRQRFDLYCAVCHGRVGDGNSLVARTRVTPAPANFHVDQLRQQPVGYFYAVATRGLRTMPALATAIAVDDRWAVAVYVRALQLSQDADVGLIPTAVRLSNGWER